RVLDAAARPVPVAVPGELHVAVDAGPEQATGVLVRVLPGGQLEYVARVGAQVRIRGYPVDPETVEAALLENPDVAAASVLVRGDSDDTYLEAYAALRPDAHLTDEELHADL